MSTDMAEVEVSGLAADFVRLSYPEARAVLDYEAGPGVPWAVLSEGQSGGAFVLGRGRTVFDAWRNAKVALDRMSVYQAHGPL